MKNMVYFTGKTTSINVHFTPQSEVKTLNVEVKAHLGPIWIPYSIDKSDACKDSGLTCPLPATKEQSYEYALKVSTSYPSVSIITIILNLPFLIRFFNVNHPFWSVFFLR